MSDDTSNVDKAFGANIDDSTDGPKPLSRFFSKKTSTTEQMMMSVDKDAPFYRMDRKKRGICLILNYDKFTIPNVEDRIGTATTCSNVEGIFRELGFDVTVKHNLTKTKTMSQVNSIAGLKHTDYDCFVMIVMTRGLDDGTLYASDDWISQEDLYGDFTADLCQTLAGKPKLFFLQVSLHSTNSTFQRDANKLKYRYPIHADFLTSYCTSTDDGPCFVQSLAEELKKNGSVGDLLSNLTAISRRIASNSPKSDGQAFVPYTAFTLTKRVLFNNDSLKLPEYSGNDDYYEMNHQRRGICLVLTHKEYTIPGFVDRKNPGYFQDRDNVETTFTQLGFEVIIHEDLTKSRILLEVGRVSQRKFSEHDCFVMVIMTHGDDDGVIYAKDEGYNCETLFSMFTDENCPKLAGKPRLFFIQACKGTNLDPGTTLYQLDHIPAIRQIPIQPDFLVAYSTIPGYYAFKDTVGGAWFIQILAEELDRSKSHDLLTILTFVNRRVAIEFESNTLDPFDHRNKKKIVPYVTSMLTKLVKFSRAGLLRGPEGIIALRKGYYSLKYPKSGAWFIQALVKELDLSSKFQDLLTILIFANQRVAIDFGFDSQVPKPLKNKQIVPYMTTRLTKLVKFC